jgi:hypothetical protein
MNASYEGFKRLHSREGVRPEKVPYLLETGQQVGKVEKLYRLLKEHRHRGLDPNQPSTAMLSDPYPSFIPFRPRPGSRRGFLQL